MKNNGNGSHLRPEHLGSPQICVELATGYEVDIDVAHFEEGLEHLANALIGEHVFASMKGRQATWEEGFEELHKGIAFLARDKSAPPLTHLLLWKLCLERWDEIKERMESEEE